MRSCPPAPPPATRLCRPSFSGNAAQHRQSFQRFSKKQPLLYALCKTTAIPQTDILLWKKWINTLSFPQQKAVKPKLYTKLYTLSTEIPKEKWWKNRTDALFSRFLKRLEIRHFSIPVPERDRNKNDSVNQNETSVRQNQKNIRNREFFFKRKRISQKFGE